MNPLIQLKTTPLLLITLPLLCFGFLPRVQAVIPPPDGGYPGFNTAEGTNALQNLTTGVGNAAVGWYSLFSNTDGSFNTALGAGTLLFNVGDQTTFEGVQNTAIGAAALFSNTTGFQNTANGALALFSNTTGFQNTANGAAALDSNTTGSFNTASGALALTSNTKAVPIRRSDASLSVRTPPAAPTRLLATVRSTAIRRATLTPPWGSTAGNSITGSGNVCIGEGIPGAVGVNGTTWIRNVYASVATTRAVYVDSDNKIGTLSSSRRYKEDVKPMDKASEMLFGLKPVTFRYKKEVDSERALSFGLIAEDVAQTSPELITRDEKGNPQTVRYEAVNAMLLNEFLKEHRTVQEQGATIARLEKQIEALTAGLQKVSAQFDASKPAPQVVNNP